MVFKSRVFQKIGKDPSFWKQFLGKYTSPQLDPGPDLAVKILDPAKRSGSPTLAAA
jgi:hypothetical protein